MLVATPILVGALGRIVVGALTDRFGGRTMFIAVSLASILPVLAVGAAGAAGSYPLLLVFGFFLGIAGTIFAVGIPFANNWYEAARRGFATGVFGMGMVGTALSAFFTPRFVRWFGLFTTHVIVAVALAVTAVVCMVVMRNSPGFTPNTGPVLPKLKAAAKLRVTWEMSFLYAVVFGGFVAFANYLPTYIKTIYGFSAVDAGARTAAFALAAVLARPIGGALSDRIAPKYVVLPRSPAPPSWRSSRCSNRRRTCGRRRRSSRWRSSSASAPAACSPGWPAAPPPSRSARSPESSPPQADWADTSRRW